MSNDSNSTTFPEKNSLPEPRVSAEKSNCSGVPLPESPPVDPGIKNNQTGIPSAEPNSSSLPAASAQGGSFPAAGLPPPGSAAPSSFSAPVKKKAPFSCSFTEGIFAFLSFLLGFFYIRWIFFSLYRNSGVSVFAFTLLFCLYLALFCKKIRGKLSSSAWKMLICTAVLGSVFIFSGNRMLKSYTLVILTLFAVWDVLALFDLRFSGTSPLHLTAEAVRGLILLPFGNFFLNVRSIIFSARKSKSGKKAGLVLLGLAIAAVLLRIILPLLKSDPAFSVLWTHLSQNFLSPSPFLLSQLFLSIPVSCYLYGLIGGSARVCGTAGEEKFDRSIQKLRIAPTPLLCAVFIPMLAVYLLFFLSQLGYFLSAFQSILPENYTYAEYARQGFFELLRICAINLLVIIAVDMTVKELSGTVRFCRSMLAAFALLFSASALSKMVLYTRIYGLTPKRLYASWMMLLLFAVFLLLGGFIPTEDCWKHIRRTAAAFFLLLLISNPGVLIARYNTAAYLDGRLSSVDISLLASLEDDAVPSLLLLSKEAPEETVRNAASREISRARHSHDFIRRQMRTSPTGEHWDDVFWGNWTVSFALADRALASAYKDEASSEAFYTDPAPPTP